MRYDLKRVQELCAKLSLRNTSCSDANAEWVEVDLGDQAVLHFLNAKDDKDCLVGFREGTGWHFHDDFVFTDRDSGRQMQLNYLDLLIRLKEGEIVVIERWMSGSLQDRRLLHVGSDDLLDDVTCVQALEAGAEVRIWKAPR